MRILTDTNIWLRYLDRSSPLSLVCRETLSSAVERQDELLICAQVMIEYWAVATRPKAANGIGKTHVEANLDLEEILELCTLLDEPADIAERWRSLANQYQPIGKAVHDLRIVAVMQAHGVRDLLTLNGPDFKRYAEIAVNAPP